AAGMQYLVPDAGSHAEVRIAIGPVADRARPAVVPGDATRSRREPGIRRAEDDDRVALPRHGPDPETAAIFGRPATIGLDEPELPARGYSSEREPALQYRIRRRRIDAEDLPLPDHRHRCSPRPPVRDVR